MAMYSWEFEVSKELLNIENGFCVDFGNTLIKVVYVRDDGATSKEKPGKRTIHMTIFQNDQFDLVVQFLKDKIHGTPGSIFRVTGLGAILQKDRLQSALDINITKLDDWKSSAIAFHFLRTHFPEESYTFGTPAAYDMSQDLEEMGFSGQSFMEKIRVEDSSKLADSEKSYLILELGSAAFCCKVNPDGTSEIIFMSPYAGCSLLGLGKLLTEAKSFDELMRLAASGDYAKVNMVGADFAEIVSKLATEKDNPNAKIKFPLDFIGLEFAKTANEAKLECFKKEDLALCLVRNVINECMMLSSLACESHKINKVFVCGSLLEGGELIRDEIIKSWKQLPYRALSTPFDLRFLKYSGYLGALGGLLKKEN